MAVEYRAIDNVTAGHNTVSAWQRHVVEGDATSVQLKLSSQLSYEVRVRSQTSVGFNTSLNAQPIYISTRSMYFSLDW